MFLRSHSQIVARKSGKQMMHHFELKTAVEEVEPFGTINIHRVKQLSKDERISIVFSRLRLSIIRWHSKMTQSDLDMQDAAHATRDNKVKQRSLPSFKAQKKRYVPKS